MSVISDISLKRLPPHNLEAEQYVLGACFRSAEAFPKSLEIIDEDDFYKSGHARIFRCLRELFESNQAIDILTLSELLRQKNEIESVGGVEFLEYLEDLVPTAEAISFHAKIVREKKILRDLIETATEIAASSFQDSEDVDLILDKAEQSIFRISEKRTKRSHYHIREVLKESFVHIEKLFEKPGLVTGVA
ncbi:MAG: replicative DNA helicase, partial [Nitrospinae bacterium]|nr:replicative DNA helicase [Nitrospinota bacterium]